MSHRLSVLTLAAFTLVTLSVFQRVGAQSLPPPRTWDELKTEVQSRADRQIYPMTAMRAEDVREILSNIRSLDRNEWGREWSAMGNRYAARARAADASDRKSARGDYLMAWRYFSFGAWPTQNAPEKAAAYRQAVDAFQRYAALDEPPVEVLRIPFEGSTIVGYLQLPPGVRPAPVVLTVGGLDSYKEYTAERYGPVYLAHKLGYLALDSPGTGEAPVKADERAERIYSAVLDYLQTRKDVDPRRIAIQGVSLGGYWATKVAFVEARRLRAAVNWAGPVDATWQREHQEKVFATREYLFDFAPAMMATYGTTSVDEHFARVPRMSLKAQGLIGKPTPKSMLVVNGLKDTLVPAEDVDILMRTGTPKTAWINADGIHLGRSPEWNDERIMREVIAPWLMTNLD